MAAFTKSATTIAEGVDQNYSGFDQVLVGVDQIEPVSNDFGLVSVTACGIALPARTAWRASRQSGVGKAARIAPSIAARTPPPATI